MKSREKIRLYFALEVIIWLLVIVLGVGAVRYHNLKKQSSFKTYQIFMQDVDGLIVGSPVRMLGVQIGYVKSVRIVQNYVYVKFVITNNGVNLPKGVIATVEFNGMAGSKSLELYPPDEISKAGGKLIAIKPTNRLGNALGLLDDMFAKLGSIIVRCQTFSDFVLGAMPETEASSEDLTGDAEKSVYWLENLINDFNSKRINFKNNLKPKPLSEEIEEADDES